MIPSPMKRLIPSFLSTLLLLAVSSALFAAKPKANQANTDDMWVTAPVPELPAGVTQHSYRSEAMQRDVGYCLYLPPSYATEKARLYPVV